MNQVEIFAATAKGFLASHKMLKYTGRYDVKIDRRWRKLHFTSGGIYGIFMEKGDG